MKNKLFAIITLLLIGFIVLSCSEKKTIPIKGTDAQLKLDTIRIGTHQYLYGGEEGKYGVILCHYEDCDNLIHPHPTPDTTKNYGLPSNNAFTPYTSLWYQTIYIRGPIQTFK